jgi:ribonuclease P protein component
MKRSLTKQERLRSRQEIDRVFREGKAVACRGMRLVSARNGLDLSRIIVIPARGHRNAVQRNHCKRLGKEAFRIHKHRIAPGYDFAIICYPGEYRYADRQEQLLHLMLRAGVLCAGMKNTEEK